MVKRQYLIAICLIVLVSVGVYWWNAKKSVRLRPVDVAVPELTLVGDALYQGALSAKHPTVGDFLFLSNFRHGPDGKGRWLVFLDGFVEISEKTGRFEAIEEAEFRFRMYDINYQDTKEFSVVVAAFQDVSDDYPTSECARENYGCRDGIRMGPLVSEKWIVSLPKLHDYYAYAIAYVSWLKLDDGRTVYADRLEVKRDIEREECARQGRLTTEELLWKVRMLDAYDEILEP